MTTQYFTLAQACEVLDYEITSLDVSLIKQGCDILKVPYIGGGPIIVKRRDDVIQEEKEVLRSIEGQVWSGIDTIIVYSKMNRNHPRFSYYLAIAIRSNDILDLKKALKIHKLKAFL